MLGGKSQVHEQTHLISGINLGSPTHLNQTVFTYVAQVSPHNRLHLLHKHNQHGTTHRSITSPSLADMNNSASRQYGACFGVLYDHGIDPDYQKDFWLPYSPCKNGLDDGDRAPANFLTRHHPINVQDDRKALFVGMVLLERIAGTEKGFANNRYRDKGWNVQQKPLSDVASFEILTRRQLAFPVFVPSQKDKQGTKRQQLQIRPVALVASPNTQVRTNSAQ